MPLDDRLTRALRREGEAIDPGRGDTGAVVATARRRVRRRRVVTGAAAAVLLLLAGAVAVTALDEEPDSRIVTEVPTTSAGPTTTVPNTAVPTTTAPVQAIACSPPVLFTDMPAGWSPTVLQGEGGGTGVSGLHLAGELGRYINIVGLDDGRVPSGGVSELALPGLGVTARRAGVHEGLGAQVPWPSACGPGGLALLGYGISDADFERVLLGMRPDSECSGRGILLNDLPPDASLPLVVSSTSRRIIGAATSCDFLGLQAITQESGDSWRDDASGESFADHLRGLEATGAPAMREIVEALTAEPALFEGAYTFPGTCLRDDLADPPRTCLDLSAASGQWASYVYRG